MPFTIVRQDITHMQVDAIVNAANSALRMGGGVCGAIFKAAGREEMQAACKKFAPVKTGEAVITPAFHLPSKYVIHAVGPVYHAWNAAQCEKLLYSAYTQSLQLAVQNGCQSLAFPLLSSGAFGYPKAKALQAATAAIRDFLKTEEMTIYLAVFDRASFAASRKLMAQIESYIDENYIKSRSFLPTSRLLEEEDLKEELKEDLSFDQLPPAGNRPTPLLKSNGAVAAKKRSEQADSMTPQVVPIECGSIKGLDELVGNLDEPFHTILFRLIDAKGKKDTEVYKKANIDRKLFSKIRTGKGYLPSKRTALALAIALELTLPETDDLLERLGYTLSHSQKFDVIIEYFILNGQYDIFKINEVLFQYNLPLLGAA